MNIHFDIYGLITANVNDLPFVSEGIPAGFPSPATDYIGELEQGDGILFDTSLAPRTGDLTLCEICGERLLKYIRRQGRAIFLYGGGTLTP